MIFWPKKYNLFSPTTKKKTLNPDGQEKKNHHCCQHSNNQTPVEEQILWHPLIMTTFFKNKEQWDIVETLPSLSTKMSMQEERGIFSEVFHSSGAFV